MRLSWKSQTTFQGSRAAVLSSSQDRSSQGNRDDCGSLPHPNRCACSPRTLLICAGSSSFGGERIGSDRTFRGCLRSCRTVSSDRIIVWHRVSGNTIVASRTVRTPAECRSSISRSEFAVGTRCGQGGAHEAVVSYRTAVAHSRTHQYAGG